MSDLLQGVDAIIFDFGNVLLDLDYPKIIQEFKKVANKNQENIRKLVMDSKILNKFETGQIEAERFLAAVNQILATDLSEAEFERIWNSMLKSITNERMEKVLKIGERFDTYILSNSNITHELAFEAMVVDATAFCRMKRSRVVTNEKIQAGDVILGLSSFGQASYETAYNSGIGSNGLTNARHDMLSHEYASKYPESFDAAVPEHLVYAGPHKLTDIEPETGQPIGKLLLSPTRTFLPLMHKVLNQYFDQVNGLIHCTGGGQTKCLKFVEKLHIVKDNLFATPPVFRLIQEASKASWKEMYQVFNMGHRLEIYTNEDTAKAIIDMAAEFNIDAQIIGRCEAAPSNKLTVVGEETVVYDSH